jgi:hypothetical protein
MGDSLKGGNFRRNVRKKFKSRKKTNKNAIRKEKQNEDDLYGERFSNEP